MKKIIYIILCLLSFLNSKAQEPISATISVDGTVREYLYYHPENAPAECPLIYVFHGFGGSNEDIMDFSEFNQLADEEGFAVCYPQGSPESNGESFWNVGYAFHEDETIDDVQFISELNEELLSNYSINPDKVFCTGFSNGAELCYLMLCQAQDIWRGIAPVAGIMLDDMITECQADNNDADLAILEIHGTTDPVSLYEGDPENLDGWGAYPSIPDMINYWVELTGYELYGENSLSDIDPNDGSTVDVFTYGWQDWCPIISLYRVNGGDHAWPGAWDNMDISATETIWQFFENIMCTGVSVTEVSSQIERELIYRCDLLGKPIQSDYKGVAIEHYSDGSSRKTVAID